MKPHLWKRKSRVYRYNSEHAQAVIFGASDGSTMWAWAVWGAGGFCAEGVEFSLRSARVKAKAKIEEAEAIGR